MMGDRTQTWGSVGEGLLEEETSKLRLKVSKISQASGV